MDITAKIDDLGIWAWIGLMVLGFMLFWPVGLAVLAFLLWSGRMGCWKRGGWRGMHKARGRWYGPSGGNCRPGESSGNSAFDEYKAETLRRLEEEQREFREFLNRLRTSKDRAEFDQFMNERRNADTGPQGPTPQPQG
jgi:hypothetical protein